MNKTLCTAEQVTRMKVGVTVAVVKPFIIIIIIK